MKQQEKTSKKPKPEVCQRLSSLSYELGALRESIRYASGEIGEAFEYFESVETHVDKLLAEKAEFSRSLDETRKRRDEALLTVKRLQNALDAALNDVAIYRRAAFWFGVSSVLAFVVATF